jgi:mRNA-degrading endonuclease YafQ of YafQ-DinJ toxin-antitoxin module
MGDPVIRESKHNMVEYLTEVTRDMKRIMDEHTILMKQLLTVLTSIRDAQQQDRWNNQGRGR